METDQDKWLRKTAEQTPRVVSSAQIGDHLIVRRIELMGSPEFEFEVLEAGTPGFKLRLAPALVLRLVRILCAFADIEAAA